MDPAPAEPKVHCVLLPCSSGETWAVPLNSVAEVLVSAEMLSGRLRWRGRELPVFAPLPAEQNSGIFAVMLGLGELAGDCWAVSLRNHSLAYCLLTEAELAGPAECDLATADAVAAFTLAGNVCVVPDLGALQVRLAAEPVHLPR